MMDRYHTVMSDTTEQKLQERSSAVLVGRVEADVPG